MNFNIYKLLIAFIALCIINVSVQAQKKHEISIYGSGGLSSLDYRLKNVNNDDVKHQIAPQIGIGYSYFFTEQWGLNTGVEYSLYKSKAELYSLIDNQSAVDDYNDAFTFMVLQRRYSEKQEAGYLNIPLMVQFQSNPESGFYAAFGAKIGIPLSGKYKYSYDSMKNKGYYPSLNVTYDDVEYRGFGEFEGQRGKEDLDFNMAIMASVEMGMKWKLTEDLRLYTGVFADYGLNDVIKEDKNMKFLPYDPENPLEFKNNSILTSEYTHGWSTQSLVGKVKPMAVGLKFKFAFSM